MNREPPVKKDTPAGPDSHVISDVAAKDLLSALVAFLQPVIRGHVTASSSTQSMTQDEITDGMEGKNLLSALTAFVGAAVRASSLAVQLEEACKITKQVDHRKPGRAPDENNAGAVPLDVPKAIAKSELEIMTLSEVRAHVFNKMPIRLLAFDNTGANIRLIGRQKIIASILPGVFVKTAEAEFQSAWAEAEALNDVNFVITSMRYRQNKMKELLKGAIERSVDYAILSHTWMRDTPGDITFHDWATRERNPRGNTKIVKFCEVAAQNHCVTLGWIDTVCINKDSSSELDESIRSMYNWYRGASVCITYLSETPNISCAHRDSWFTRGWTLQELLAPVRSVFYNEDWNQLGSSSDIEIQSVIQTATGITNKELVLSWSGEVAQIPFSRRMQMACGRQVTREEDTSYSLMGILGVDISIAYGEGTNRAFFRLVRELFNTKKNVIDLFNRSYDYGEKLLPSSLESYRYRTDWHDYPDGGTQLDKYLPLEPIIPTNLGVRIPLLLVPGFATDNKDDENYTPKGDLSGQTSFRYFSKTGEEKLVHFLLFDSRLYTGDLGNLRETNPITLPDGARPIIMLGIVNFGIDTTGHILLPEQCFGLDITWDGLQDGNFSAPENVELRAGGPAQFLLQSKKGFKIRKEEVGEHGMQLVSFYL